MPRLDAIIHTPTDNRLTFHWMPYRSREIRHLGGCLMLKVGETQLDIHELTTDRLSDLSNQLAEISRTAKPTPEAACSQLLSSTA
jgi:hypothetical protein